VKVVENQHRPLHSSSFFKVRFVPENQSMTFLSLSNHGFNETVSPFVVDGLNLKTLAAHVLEL